MPEALSLPDIREMHLHGRERNGLERVENGNARMRIRRRVNNDAVHPSESGLDGVYDRALVVGLEQRDHEGAIVDAIQAAYGTVNGIIINPAAYTHTSVAILDALKAVALPAVEVHLSDVNQRESFRHVSYAGMACEKTFAGFGFEGYKMAIEHLARG